MLYDRPVADLMSESAAAMPRTFKASNVVDWFAQHYPKVKTTTVRAHVIGLTANDPSRKHYPGLAQRQPLFVKSSGGWLELFDADVHLADEPEQGVDEEADEEAVDLSSVDVVHLASSQSPADAQEFYLEAYLEEFLLTNWARIDWGRRLGLWSGSSGQSGHQLATPIGRLDFLCEDLDNGALVEVELKRGLPSDRVVGQTARYMGWVAEHLADGQRVDGLIVAHDVDDRLKYAVRPVEGLSLLVYEISFALRQPTDPVRRVENIRSVAPGTACPRVHDRLSTAGSDPTRVLPAGGMVAELLSALLSTQRLSDR